VIATNLVRPNAALWSQLAAENAINYDAVH